MSIYHVEPHGNAWTAAAEDSARSTQVFATREEAIAAAKEMARTHAKEMARTHAKEMAQVGVTVVVHKADGTIERSYAPDELADWDEFLPGLESDIRFENDLDYLVEKNAELYQRLAR